MNRAEAFFAEAISRGELGHAYLLEAEDGETRKACAGRIVRRIVCEKQTGCGQCPACRAFDGNNHPDVIWVSHEKPNVISVEEIRRQLVDDMGIRPYRGGRKIYLVDEAEKMNPQAQNALLKTLEEPPEYGMIFLLCGNRNAFLPTVLSRLVALNAEEFSAEEAENISETAALDELFGLLARVKGLSAAETAGIATLLKGKGMSPENAAERLTALLRDLLVVKSETKARLYFPEEERLLKDWADTLSDEDCDRLWQSAAEIKARLASNVNPDMVFEIFFLRLRDALRA